MAVLKEIIEFDKKNDKKNTIEDRDRGGNTPLILGKIFIHVDKIKQLQSRKYLVRKNFCIKSDDKIYVTKNYFYIQNIS